MRRNDSRAAPSSATKLVLKNCDKPHNITRKPIDLRIIIYVATSNLVDGKAPIIYREGAEGLV
jgi:hypothetical protein